MPVRPHADRGRDVLGRVGRAVVPRVRCGLGMARGVAATGTRTPPRQGPRDPNERALARIGHLTRAAAHFWVGARSGHSPLKRGSRFSMNAIIASAVSRDENISAWARPSLSTASAIV
jgi:hypothetical protein